MNLRALFASLFLASFAAGFAADELPVQLLLPSRHLQPTSTFNVRFAAEMAPPEQIGALAAESPLVFQPPLKGQFVWLSTRSGTFAPKAAPPLGTTFRITLRRGLKDAAGQEVAAKLNETVETPPMRVKGVQPGEYHSAENAPARPRFTLLFNTNVRAGDAAKYLKFIDSADERIPANVQQADDPNDQRAFSPGGSDDRSLLTWAEAFSVREDGVAGGEDDEGPDAPRRNQLFVTPSKPLPPGQGWTLVVEAGLPSAESNVRLPEPRKIPVGNVKPFTVEQVSAENGRHDGRVLIVQFSKPLSEAVTKENVSRWVSVKPEPKNLRAEVADETITFYGDFTLGVPYRVIANRGIPSREPFTLAQAAPKEVVFERIPARLYFQDFATHQLLGGTRKLRLLSINVPRVRVTAKLIAPEAVPLALRMYEHYREHEEQLPDDEYFARVDAEKTPGKTIWHADLDASPDVDKQATLALNWDEILGVHRSGAVLLTAESLEPVTPKGKRCGTQALVQLTDLGAVWKRSKAGTFLHVFSLAGGKPIAAAKVRLLDGKQKALGEAATDAHGIALLPPSGETGKWISIESGEDSHVIDLSAGDGEVPLYRLGIEDFDSEGGNESNDARAVFLFTERGVYKPGDTVRLKGVARDLSGDRPRAPAGEKLTVTVTDTRDRQVFLKEVTLSEFGSFDEQIKLPEGTLGTYRVTATTGGEREAGGSHTFQVQEYRPNTFEVAIGTPPATTGPLQLELPVTAKYFMGKPLPRAKITWTLVARDAGFRPERLDAFAFCNGIENPALNRALDRLSQLNDQGEAELSAASGAVVSTPLSINPKAPQPRAAKLLCEVTDLNQQTVSESASFVQHSSDFYFGLRRLQPLVKEGEPLHIELIAVRTDGTPLPEPAQATLRLTRIDWQSNRLGAAGDATEFENKPVFTVIWQAEVATAPPEKENGRLVPKASSPPPVLAGKPGQYLLEAIGKDAAGHAILTSLNFYVSGAGETVWDYRNPYAIDLVPDKQAYETGQTATLLVKTPIAGEALVTVERDRVLRSFVTTLHGNAPTVEIPLTDADAPNVFVSVMMLRGAEDSPRKLKTPEYRMGCCELKITRPADKLTVYVKPAASAYRPGETVELNAEVLDLHGKPVANAELVLYAVDEGVLSLTGYMTPDPLAFFNKPRRLRVETGLTLPTLLREDLAEADFANKGYLIGDGKGGAGDNGGLRKNFLACAFWNATLRTNAEGRLQAKLTAPDSLTRYRVVAIAQTKESQFGGGESSFEINKPVMLEPSLPRFANLGDKLVLRGVLHNMSDTDGDADVELQLDQTAKAAETKRRVSLPAHASVALDFPVEMIATGRAQWRWSAAFAGADGKTAFRDEVESELKVGYPAPLVREVHTSRIEGGGAEVLRLSDPEILEGAGVVRVHLTNTRAIELGESLRQLLQYPYGCVEQTTSSMLPWLSLRDLRGAPPAVAAASSRPDAVSLGSRPPPAVAAASSRPDSAWLGLRGALPELAKTDEEIAAAVNRGINLLLSMQTSSNGLAYWPGGKEPMLWGSAYGALGLALAHKQGFTVPSQEYDRLLRYLSAKLRGLAADATGYGLSDYCLTVYALAVAGRPEPAYHEALFKKRATLSAEDRGLLALALIESGGPAAMIDELLRTAPDERAYVEEWFGCPAREDALHLLAWTLHAPKSPRVDELATELFTRRSGGHWVTTQGNAWSILALSAYLRGVERGPQTSAGEIAWSGRMQPFALSPATRLATAEFPLVAATAREPLKVTKNPDGQVFSEVTVEARPPTIAQPRQDRGYAISRRYTKLEDDDRASEAKELRVGDRVLVTLDIEVRRRATYVAVEDPLPAMFEAINPVFKSQETAKGAVAGADWISSYRELREDRALFFADTLYPGRYHLRYLARVITAGNATAPAAKIQEMYHPERFGTTGALQVAAMSLK